ncbi:MAG: site-2 protease family protein [Candidatus Paceibacterota bacterium]|nr:MAG: site-2 protease family protein [Candidatus Paceibacterota bacterium]
MAGPDFIFIIVILIMSVVIHELAHGYSALWLGDSTAKYAGRLTLNPIKHLDPVGSVLVPLLLYILPGNLIFGWAKPVPYNPYNLRNQKWGEAIVAAAGPLTNILIAVIFGLIVRLNVVFGVFPPAFTDLASIVVFMNIILAIFNLVPIPPLDGSKILFSVLPYHMQRFRLVLEQFGLILVIFFIFVLWRFIFPVVLWFFYLITGPAGIDGLMRFLG